MLSHRIRRETPSVLVKSSSFHRILNSAPTLPLPDPLQHVELAVPPLPGSDANLHHLPFFYHSYLWRSSSTTSSLGILFLCCVRKKLSLCRDVACIVKVFETRVPYFFNPKSRKQQRSPSQLYKPSFALESMRQLRMDYTTLFLGDAS